MQRTTLWLALALTACPKPTSTAAPPPTEETSMPGHPETPKRPVADTFHGTEVTEDYRWLEDDSAEEVVAWQAAQDAVARETLDTYPVVAALTTELTRLLSHEAPSFGPFYAAGGELFAKRATPPAPHAVLVHLPDPADPTSAVVLVDPNALDPDGLTSLDLVVPSPDGTKVAVALSHGGTEAGDVTVVDVATGKVVDGPIPRVTGGTAGGAVAWLPDGSGFLYTRYPRQGERPEADMDFYVQVYTHVLGTDTAEDTYMIGEDFTRIAEIDLEAHHATGQLLVTVQDGDGGEFAHWVGPLDGELVQFSEFGDRTVAATFSEHGESVYAVTLKDAPRGRLVRTPAATPDIASATEVVPEGEDTIVASFWGPKSVLERAGRVYVQVQTGGPSEIRAFTIDGEALDAPAAGEVAYIGGMVPDADGGFWFGRSTYTEPWALWHVDGTGAATKTPYVDPSIADFAGVEVVRTFATSKDGTQVPVNVLKPVDMPMDGSTPCVVTGYGGYGISLSPWFAETAEVLLSRGVCFAVANLRGGGEYGESWHLEGNLVHKQNVFDDFHAVLTHLVDEGYTSRDKLGIRGGSNGGLLMGAQLTQHPESVAAVMSAVGIYDMLRVELSPNGAFNIPEFGTVEDPAQFAALHAYSPYHHVDDEVAYPPVLFTTGANDPRVEPWQSRKMTARLQAARGGPVLLRVEMDAGHGTGNLQQRIALLAHQYGFLLHHLGIEE